MLAKLQEKINKVIFKTPLFPFKVFLSVLLVFLFLFVGFIFYLKNHLAYQLIENNLSNFLGIKIELIEPQTNFTSHFNLSINAKEINFYDFATDKKYASLKNLKIITKPFGVLFKKINIKSLTLDEAILSIKRDSSGQIDLFQNIHKENIEKIINKKIELTRLNADIKKIEVNYFDNFKLKSSVKTDFNDTNIQISKKDKLFKVNNNGKITTITKDTPQISDIKINLKTCYPFKTNMSSNSEIDISLKDFNLLTLSDLFSEYISKEINYVSGKVDFSIKTNKELSHKINSVITNFKLHTNDKVIIPYKTNINLEGIFNFDKNNVIFKDFILNSDNLSISLNGKINDFLSKNIEPDLNLKINNTQINNLVSLIPDNAIYYNLKGIPTLKKSNFFANLNADINLNNFIPLNLNGNLKAENVHIPKIPKPSIQNDVNIFFMNNKMRVYTRVYTPDKNEYVLVDGISNLDDSLYGKYTIKSTQKIDLTFAQKYLVPIQQIVGFNIGPVPLMNMTGWGNIDIKVQGTFEDGQIYGLFNAENATVEMQGIDAKLTNGSAKLVFDNKNIILKEIKGKINNADFNLSGNANTKGEINLNSAIDNISLLNALKIFENSNISNRFDFAKKKIVATSGLINVLIKLTGKINDFEDVDFLQKITMNGSIDFNKNAVFFNNGLKIKNLFGRLNFGNQQDLNIRYQIGNSGFTSNITIANSLENIAKTNKVDIKAKIISNNLYFSDIFSNFVSLLRLDKQDTLALDAFAKLNFVSKLNLNSHSKISLSNLDLSRLISNGYWIPLNSENYQSVRFNSGMIKFENNKMNLLNFDIDALSGKIKINGFIKNFLSKEPNFDLNSSVKNVHLINLSDFYSSYKMNDILIKNADFILKNDNLKISNLSLLCDQIPMFLNLSLNNFYTTKNLEANYSTILNEYSTDKIINPYLTYPINIKGEIPLNGSIKGKNENYVLNFDLILPKNSDIYFIGANIGDENIKREFSSNINISKNQISINDLRLIKHIANQNNKVNPINTLIANGKIIHKEKDFYYDNFKIRTNSPINVRLLNLIFKKSILKNGNFECDIIVNDSFKTPKITGKIFLQDLDVPLYDAIVNQMKFNISNNYIDGVVFAKNKESDIKTTFRAKNNFEMPYILEKLNIESNNLNILDTIKSLNSPAQKTDILQKQDFIVKPEDIIVKKGEFDFKNIQYDKITAQNLKGEFEYKNKIFKLKNSVLDIAQGKIFANAKYEFDSAKLALNAKMKECESNILTEQFLNLKDQIFGKIDGDVVLEVKNPSALDGIKTLKSTVNFAIDNGKMPKLGSLEYLLRAGNILRSGLFGLSLNNLIQILAPYKTGEFEKISGDISIKGGEVENINIYSQGKNLSMYLTGEYSIFDNFANVMIYGKLSQTISNALGSVGNASLSQVINSITKDEKNKKQLQENFEKIPVLENENQNPKYFKAKIIGDINKDNYIKNFSWE